MMYDVVVLLCLGITMFSLWPLFLLQLGSSRGIKNDVSYLRSFPNLSSLIPGNLFTRKCTPSVPYISDN